MEGKSILNHGDYGDSQPACQPAPRKNKLKILTPRMGE